MLNKETNNHQPYRYTEEGFDDHRAAPLLLFGDNADPKMIRSQNRIARNFNSLVHEELSPIAKPSVVKFVAKSIVTRMHQREGSNGVSYFLRANEHPLMDEVVGYPLNDIETACENIKSGNGTVLQNEIARIALGMNSVEYANLTIVGDKRRHLEGKMWDELSDLVGHDTAPGSAEDFYRLKVLAFNHNVNRHQHIGAMRIGMKRDLGSTPNGALVKARTTAIINTSPSGGLDPNLSELFIDTARRGEDVAELPEFKKAVSWLIESRPSRGIVLARNETAYGVSPEKAADKARAKDLARDRVQQVVSV